MKVDVEINVCICIYLLLAAYHFCWCTMVEMQEYMNEVLQNNNLNKKKRSKFNMASKSKSEGGRSKSWMADLKVGVGDLKWWG